MRPPSIVKSPAETARANLSDYRWLRHDFTWKHAREWLSGLPDGRGLNIAHEAVDRHVAAGAGNRVAVRCVGRTYAPVQLTYDQLRRQTNRFANLLGHLGVRPEHAVLTLLGHGLTEYVVGLGTLKHTATLVPLPPGASLRDLRYAAAARARVLVTTVELYNSQVAPVRERLPGLRHVLIAGIGRLPAGTQRLADLLAEQPDSYRIPPTAPDQPALLHVTDDDGVRHSHGAVLGVYVSALFALDLQPDDVFWCTAEPGLPTATWYGLIGALAHGITVVTDAGRPDSRRRLRILRDEWVTVWHPSVPVLRALMLPGVSDGVALPALRHVVSFGNPFAPDVVQWGRDVLGHPIHQTWSQPATGGIVFANFAGLDLRPGSAGLPMPGAETAVLALDDGGAGAALRSGSVAILTKPDELGEVAIRADWPAMCAGQERAGRPIGVVDGWYLTGELATRDADGYFWFTSKG
jgi:acetyl-CoA synthetase